METSNPTLSAPPPKPRRWLRRIAKTFLVLLVLGLVIIGPWPAPGSTYVGSAYQTWTLARLAETPAPAAPAGPIRVGVGEVDISPPPGHPLAGFGERKPKGYTRVDTPCFARALTIERGDLTVTILTADMLMVNRKLAAAVLERTGLSATPERLYFTSSHTHSGPGAWGDTWLEELTVGPYDPAYFNTLADQLARAVVESRSHLQPAEFALVVVPTHHRVENRVDVHLQACENFTAMLFRSTEPPRAELAILLSFSAHATLLNSASHSLSADYPGALMEEVKTRTGAAHVLFAAGSVGDARPLSPGGLSQSAAARVYGSALADDLMPALAHARYRPDISLAAIRTPIEFDVPRVCLGGSWRLSPLCSWWVSDRYAHLHALRIGDAVWVGMPGDFSGHLTHVLQERVAAGGDRLVVTSFNGDYKGYFVSRAAFLAYPGYETRAMNFFGPWSGEFLSDTALRSFADSGGGSPGKRGDATLAGKRKRRMGRPVVER